MFNPKKNSRPSFSTDWIVDNFQQHPCMVSVETLKDKLKQEKLQDKAFYQSLKKKIADANNKSKI